MDASSPPRPYHHGDLRAALLSEAEVLLRDGGVPALTLRAVSRAAGVTHAAPANHFGDLTGLLSELAADGFRRLATQILAATAAASAGPRNQALAVGRAYLAFARANPQLFLLMFRSERLDPARPALRDAVAATGAVLRGIAAAPPDAPPGPPGRGMAEGVALWSLVHGYAMLLLDGRLRPVLAALPESVGEEAFAEAVLTALRRESLVPRTGGDDAP